ncbi:hypothetical protein EYC80_000320 [Monilinia laxa]|uniref:Uncharacterized protein n=1 Tax=Monilinia laxa TaxID=61186 RepID=A0A5N6KA98_MONLA|nr:hypothetical protein EYC80_000320 [Monilinia laxa]
MGIKIVKQPASQPPWYTSTPVVACRDQPVENSGEEAQRPLLLELLKCLRLFKCIEVKDWTTKPSHQNRVGVYLCAAEFINQ